MACAEGAEGRDSVLSVDSLFGYLLLVFLVLVAGASWWILMSRDARRVYEERVKRRELLERLVNRAVRGRSSERERRYLVKALNDGWVGIPGLARSLVGFAIITLVGLGLLLLFTKAPADVTDLEKQIITGLLTALATIIGFYFGARTASEAATAAVQAADETSGPEEETPAPPTIISFEPVSGPPGTPVVIRGANLEEAVSVRFADSEAAFTVDEENRTLQAEVPEGATTGRIAVTAPAGSASSEQEFEVGLNSANSPPNPTRQRARRRKT